MPPIDTKYDTSIDSEFGKETTGLDIVYDVVPDGVYFAELARFYKWKQITKDTTVSSRDADGKIMKDSEGNNVKEEVKGLSWYVGDYVFRVVCSADTYDKEYRGRAIKGSLSTHPDMKRALSNFMYSAKLFGVPAKDIDKYVGKFTVKVHVKNKTRTFKDKTTSLDKTVTEPYVSYCEQITDTEFDKLADIENEGFGL